MQRAVVKMNIFYGAVVMSDQVTPIPAKILCVDDEPNILSALKRLLRSSGYQIVTAESGAEGLEILSTEHIDLIISDMRMPEMDGAKFLEQARANWPDCIRILLTGYSEIQSLVSAINRGEIHRYIAKPWDEHDILLIIKQALERKSLEDEKKRLEALIRTQNEELKILNASLEEKIQERTVELKKANEKLKGSFITSIKVFSSLIDLRGGKLSGHSRRVADVARKLALKMNLDANVVQDIFVAGLLVDIGKIGFSDELLNLSMNQMNDKQLEQFQQHPIRAEQALMPLDNLQASAKILRSQHERIDGTGFPDGLTEIQIPQGAMILAIASDYDSLQNGTILQKKMSPEEARDMICRAAGTSYDIQVVNAFKELFLQHTNPEDHIEVEAKDLRAGMILQTDLISREGTLLLPAEYVLSGAIIDKLKKYSESNFVKLRLKIHP
jgi:response regulator RpfG family c-di-GMP phosphodiesterase